MLRRSKSAVAVVLSIITVVAVVAVAVSVFGARPGHYHGASGTTSAATTTTTPSTTVPAVTPAYVQALAKGLQISITVTPNSNAAITEEAAAAAAQADDPWHVTITNASLVTAEDPTTASGGMSLYWLLNVSPSGPVYAAAPMLSDTTGRTDPQSGHPANLFSVFVDATTGEVVTRTNGYDPNYTP